jgi:hypothetical protein
MNLFQLLWKRDFLYLYNKYIINFINKIKIISSLNKLKIENILWKNK